MSHRAAAVLAVGAVLARHPLLARNVVGVERVRDRCVVELGREGRKRDGLMDDARIVHRLESR